MIRKTVFFLLTILFCSAFWQTPTLTSLFADNGITIVKHGETPTREELDEAAIAASIMWGEKSGYQQNRIVEKAHLLLY